MNELEGMLVMGKLKMLLPLGLLLRRDRMSEVQRDRQTSQLKKFVIPIKATLRRSNRPQDLLSCLGTQDTRAGRNLVMIGDVNVDLRRWLLPPPGKHLS